MDIFDNGNRYYLTQDELSAGVPVTGYLYDTNDFEVWFIQVFSDAYILRVVITGPSDSDFDVYARYGEIPTTDDYDIRGYTASSYEREEVEQPLSGTWFISVNSYSGSGTYTLTVFVSYSETTTSSTTPIIHPIPTISEDDIPQVFVLILSVLGLMVVIWSLNKS